MSSFTSKTLPDSFRKCMAPEERKTLNTPTQEEADEKCDRRLELKMHGMFKNWCRLNAIAFVYSRSDRKATINEGHPDFTLLRGGLGCCVEFKHGCGKLRKVQEARLKELAESQVPCLVSWTVKDAVVFASNIFGLKAGGNFSAEDSL